MCKIWTCLSFENRITIAYMFFTVVVVPGTNANHTVECFRREAHVDAVEKMDGLLKYNQFQLIVRTKYLREKS
jgi:hypothetical protein